MADLLSTFANAYPYDPNSVWRGAQGVQNVMSNALDYQQKREALEAQRGLKALYAQNPNPSYEDIARIDPAFAMQQNKANFEMQKELLGMKETQGKINKQQQEEIHFFANAVGPVVEQYLMNTGGEGNAQQQAALKQQIGAGLRDIEQRTGMRPTNADALLNMSPSEMLNRLMLNGYQSPILKGQIESQTAIQREQMMRGLPPAMTPQQVYGGVEMGPYGPRRVPGIGGQPMTPGPQYGVTPFNPNAGQMQQGPMPGGMQQAPIGAEDLGILKQNRAQMQPGPERDALDRMIAEVETGKVAQPPAGDQFVTGQDIQRLKAEEERLKSQLETEKQLNVEKGKQEMQEQFAARKAVNAYDMLPDPNRIRNLIKGSISGDTEYWANRLGGVVGKSLESGDVTAALKVIEGQMADTVAMFPGAQSDKELEARMKTIGDPSAAVSADTRLKAFDFWLERMQKYVTQHADFDDTKLLDMVKEQKLTADQAMAIRKKRMAGGR